MEEKYTAASAGSQGYLSRQAHSHAAHVSMISLPRCLRVESLDVHINLTRLFCLVDGGKDTCIVLHRKSRRSPRGTVQWPRDCDISRCNIWLERTKNYLQGPVYNFGTSSLPISISNPEYIQLLLSHFTPPTEVVNLVLFTLPEIILSSAPVPKQLP